MGESCGRGCCWREEKHGQELGMELMAEAGIDAGIEDDGIDAGFVEVVGCYTFAIGCFN